MAGKTFHRSPLLLDSRDSAIVVVDVQERLVPHIDGQEFVVENIERLLATAELLSVAAVVNEQYPKGLGPTVESIRKRLEQLAPTDKTGFHEKIMFSCRESGECFGRLWENGIKHLLICGIETHVCVAQTVMDMMAAGFIVSVPVDAVGSRFAQDHEVALRRLEANGCQLTTTEAAMFELCERAGTDAFKPMTKLLRKK